MPEEKDMGKKENCPPALFTEKDADDFSASQGLGEFVSVSNMPGTISCFGKEFKVFLEIISTKQDSKLVSYVFSPFGISNIVCDGKCLLEQNDPFLMFVRLKRKALTISQAYIQTKAKMTNAYLLFDNLARRPFSKVLSEQIKKQPSIRNSARRFNKTYYILKDGYSVNQEIEELFEQEKNIRIFRDFHKFLTLALFNPQKRIGDLEAITNLAETLEK